jgi:hypothetical protein
LGSILGYIVKSIIVRAIIVGFALNQASTSTS